MNDKLISIVIPVYNVEQFLDECIESIVNQTYKKIEIVLVNDCSTDNSLGKCLEWEKKDHRIKVYSNKENIGLGGTRNEGMTHISGEYVYFLDSDDYLPDNAIEELIILHNKTGAEVCGGTMCLVNQRTGEKTVDYYHSEIAESTYLNWSMCNKLISVAIMKNNGIEFPRLPYEDAITSPILECLANKVANTKTVTYYYRRNTGYSIMQDDSHSFKLDSVLEWQINNFLKRNIAIDSKIAQVVATLFFSRVNILKKCIAPGYDHETQKKALNCLRRSFRLIEDNKILDFLDTDERETILKHTFCLGGYYNKLFYTIADYGDLKEYNEIIVYGAGIIGKDVVLKLYELGVEDFLVAETKTTEEKSLLGKRVQELEKIETADKSKSLVIIASGMKYKTEMKENAERLGYTNILML